MILEQEVKNSDLDHHQLTNNNKIEQKNTDIEEEVDTQITQYDT